MGVLTRLPATEERYLREITAELRGRFGGRLLAVWLFGSGSYGDYVRGSSDIDITAVFSGPLGDAATSWLIDRLDHASFPCPARRLEFVCYEARDIAVPARHPRFQLNLNTGAGIARHATMDPASEADHWFLLDLAIGRELGRALHGAAPAQLICPLPRSWQLAATLDALTWHAAAGPADAPNRVLNACRTWRYAVTGSWGSKHQGARWVATHHADLPVVPAARAAHAQAAAMRRSGPPGTRPLDRRSQTSDLRGSGAADADLQGIEELERRARAAVVAALAATDT